jgi:hypothetical protein
MTLFPNHLPNRNFGRFLAWITAAVAIVAASPVAHAFISEPETIIYGRIVNRTGGQSEQLVTSGNLVWKIQRADGSEISLTGEVGELQGSSSYFVRVPHNALVVGESSTSYTLPLGLTRSSASHIEITLDNHPTRILSPASSNIDLEQALRASTYRIDLEVIFPELDSDGDGTPDWWEDLHGLDKQNSADALQDSDRDGLSNRAEFLAGSLPTHDSRHPELKTSEVIAYSSSTSIINLETIDIDSTPAQLLYTVIGLPTGGQLILRNPDTILTTGSTFTQLQINQGQLIFRHNPDQEIGSLEVSVSDENPSHPAASGNIGILLFAPSPATSPANGSEKLRLFAHHLTSNGSHHIADLSSTAGSHLLSAPSANISPAAYPAFTDSYGPEKPHILLGAAASDILSGGYSDDILSGGPGADNFIYTDPGDANDTITDFTPSQGDSIDLSSILIGDSTSLYHYVRILADGPDALLGVSINGTATGYNDLVLRLKNSQLRQTDIANLYYSGNLITGNAALPPRLSVTASATKASENGPTPSQFVIHREGPLDTDVSVGLSFSGTATNGSDFQIVSSTLLMPAGEVSITIPIIPFVDAVYENDEVIVLSLNPNPSFLLGTSMAQLVIEDLKPQLWTEVIQNIASVDGLSPATVILHRQGAIDRSVTVQLNFTGTAVKNVDYVTPPSSISFAAWDTEREIHITPKATATFGTAEAKTVLFNIKPSNSYVSNSQTNRLLIVPRIQTYESWLTSTTLGQTDPNADPGGHGMNLLLRYGFSLDPVNPTSSLAAQRMPKVEFINDYLTLRFRRNPAISDLVYQVQYSTDLVHWNQGPEFVEEITHQVAPTDPGAAVFRAKAPASANPRAAMRVVITKPENP